MAKELIYIADDFGMNSQVNDAILYAHLSGHLTGASLMMAQPGTEEAIAMACANPSLRIGWHLHLNDSVPATTDHWPWGASPARAGWSIGLFMRARELMRREVTRQWSLFQATGLECHFINSHHHLHAHPLVYRTLLDAVGPQFQGWIRLGKPRAFRAPAFSPLWSLLNWTYLERRRRLSAWRTTDTLWGVRPRLHAEEVRAIVATLPSGFHEFLFHPRTRSCPDTLCLIQLRSALEHS
jgi:chitin disaccharide deacetylase